MLNFSESNNKSKTRVKSNIKSKPVLIIAVASAIIILSTGTVTAFASNLFGLKDLVMSQSSSVNSDEEKNDTISLSGYIDSPESKACEEWNDFLSNYDTDGKILSQIGNNPTEFDEDYGLYMVYTQEMADKLNEIAKKYNLTLLKSINVAENSKDLIKLTGNKEVVRNYNNVINWTAWGYRYNEGSFRFEGDVWLDSKEEQTDENAIGYQASCTNKGIMSEVCLTIGDSNEYQEVRYVTKDNVESVLALSRNKALIIVNSDSKFIVINVLEGTEKISMENLKKIADTFKFNDMIAVK